jgi:hypothetical protein
MVEHQQAIAEIIAQDPNIRSFMSSVGATNQRPTSNTGTLSIMLKPAHERKLTPDQIIQELRPKLAAVPGIRVYMQNPPVIRIGGQITALNIMKQLILPSLVVCAIPTLIVWLRFRGQQIEKVVLTFPVQTVALLTENKKPKHSDFVKFLSKEMEQGNTFFVYMSDNADTLSSCCRLANAIVDNTFSYTLGAGGVATGSTKVITINFNRVIQKGIDLEALVERIHKYLVSHRKLMETMKANQMLPVYDAGFISLDKQYLTVGLNGVMEAAEFLGYTPSNNKEYKEWLFTNILFLIEN